MTCITEKSNFMGVNLFSSLLFHQTVYIATTTTTAWKSMFSFSRLPEKMVFPKQSRWNMIFLVLLGKMIFLFPENMILPPGGRWKIIFLQKNTRKYDVFFKLSEKIVFSKITTLGHDLSCITMFSPKTWYLFPVRKMKGRWPFPRNKRKHDIFCLICSTSPCQKNQRWSYPAKST